MSVDDDATYGALTMQPAKLTYGILAGVTPTLVLLNSVLSSTPPESIRPLQSISLTEMLMDSEPKTLAQAHSLIPGVTAAASQARIVTKDGQSFLEFHHSFSTVSQTPDLMLILDANPAPNDNFHRGDRQFMVGQLQSAAGNQQYPIPNSVDVYQYLSVVIWCPALDAVMGYAPLAFAG